MVAFSAVQYVNLSFDVQVERVDTLEVMTPIKCGQLIQSRDRVLRVRLSLRTER